MITVETRLGHIVNYFAVGSAVLLILTFVRTGLSEWVQANASLQQSLIIAHTNRNNSLLTSSSGMSPLRQNNISEALVQAVYPHMHLVQAMHSKQIGDLTVAQRTAREFSEFGLTLIPDTEYDDVRGKDFREPPNDIMHEALIHDKTFASDEEGRLIRDLFRNYNKLIRPVKNKTDHINVAFGLSLIQLINVKWNDFQLVWTPQDYGNIKTIRIPYSRIWTPDIVLFNNADGKYEVSTKCNVVLNFDGGVLWVPPSIYKSSCTIDVEYFPFDEQHCIMRFGSWTFNGDEVGFSFFDDREFIDLNDFSVSGTWDVINVPAFLNIDNRTRPTVTDVSFHMYIRRKTLFYTVNLLAPCIMMSFLSVLVFYLPPDGNEKITLGISILLAIVLFQLVVSKLLPPTSLTIPLIAKYLLFTFVMNLICVLFTVIIVNWNFRAAKTHHLPRWLRTLFIDILPKFIFMRRPVLIRPSNSTSYSFDEDEGDWAHSKSTMVPATPATYAEIRLTGSRDLNKPNLSYSDANLKQGATHKFTPSYRVNLAQGIDLRTGLNETNFNCEEFGNYKTAAYAEAVSSNLTNDICPSSLVKQVNEIKGGHLKDFSNIAMPKTTGLRDTPALPSSFPYPHTFSYNNEFELMTDPNQATFKKIAKPSIKRCISKTSLLKSRDNSLELSEFHKNLNNYRFASTSNPKDLNDCPDIDNSLDTSVDNFTTTLKPEKNLNYQNNPSHFLTEKDLREIEELARLEHDITNFGYPSNGSSENDTTNNGKYNSNGTHIDSCMSEKEVSTTSIVPKTDISMAYQNFSRQPPEILSNRFFVGNEPIHPVIHNKRQQTHQPSRTNTIVRQDSLDLGMGEESTIYLTHLKNKALGLSNTNLDSSIHGTQTKKVDRGDQPFTIPDVETVNKGDKSVYLNQNFNNNNSNDPILPDPYCQTQVTSAAITPTFSQSNYASRYQRADPIHSRFLAVPHSTQRETAVTLDITLGSGGNVTQAVNECSRHLSSRSHSNDAILVSTRPTTPTQNPVTKKGAEKKRRRKKCFPHIPTRIVKGAARDVIFVARHLKQEDENNMEREDWKYIAIVIDRILLYIFIIVTLGGTLGIITSAPHIFEYVDQQERIQFLTGQKTA